MRFFGRALSALLIVGISASTVNAVERVTADKRTVTAPNKVNRELITDPAVLPQGVLVPATVPAPVCSREKVGQLIAALRATPSASSPSVEIDCSLTLPANIVITKRIIFKGSKASGVTVNGNGATISGAKGTFHFNPRDAALMVQIISDECRIAANGEPRCPRPESITIRNLKIKGSVGISGDAGVPSTDDRFVRLARTNAPANIVFDNVTITGLGLPCVDPSANCNLLYIFSGVSHFTMINSEINGSTSDKAVAIYLDDVSFRNTFRNNFIRAATTTREVIAIDGSSENVFINNRIQVFSQGGIFLYRNCGEDNSPRRGTPSNNTFINNVFEFGKIKIGMPAMVVAQRNGKSTKKTICPPNFFDLAKFNVVMQNQIVPEIPVVTDLDALGDMIKVGRPDMNTPNFIKENEVLDRKIDRGAGCYVRDGYPDFIRTNDFVNVFHNANGEPVCRGYRLSCRDGVLARSSDSVCDVSKVSSRVLNCQISDSNDGCRKTVSGPPGTKLIGFKAACNLEFGTVTMAELNAVPANSIKVLRASDNAIDGSCTLGRAKIGSGESAVGGINGQNSVTFGCREKDSNGGDCHIKTRLFFQ